MLVLPLYVAGIPPAIADAAPPTQVAVCLSCHGNGMKKPADPAVPIIAGQQYAYLLSALNAYRNGERTGTSAQLMTAVARALNPPDVNVAAEFFANLRSVQW